jgi:diaminopimelate decarboxylase
MELSDLLPFTSAYNSNGVLSVAGHDLASLVKEWGTPLYIYDGETVQRQVSSLRQLLHRHYPGKSEITYAAKAYFSLAFARKLASLDVGVDVVSQGELALAQKAGFLPNRIHLHGNNKSEAELASALEACVQAIVVDSLEELAFLESLAEKLQKPGRIWLRITPGITVDTHQYTQTAHPASKFGLPIQDGQAAEAIRRLRLSRRLTLTGLHAHLGSQFFEPEPYRLAIARLAELAEQENFLPLQLSPGGGWGVPYNLQARSNDPQPWIETICSSLQHEFGRRNWPLPELIVEPGRWIAARAGIAIYSVGATKTASDGTRFVAVDGGMADNIRPALYQAQYTALPVVKSSQELLEKFVLVGKFCETGDVMIPEVELPPLKRGDLLAVPVSGAYHLSMASNYNLAARPPVLWLEADHIDVLQKREMPEEKGWWVGE